MVQVVLVPFPLTPLSVFAYYFLEHLGVIDAFSNSRYHNSSEGNQSTVVLGDGFILRMSHKDLYEYLISHLPYVRSGEKGFFRRCITFFQSAPAYMQEPWRNWILRHSFQCGQLDDVLDITDQLLDVCRKNELDPWRDPFPGKTLSVPKVINGNYPLDKRFGALPILKSAEPGEKEVSGVKGYVLSEGGAWKLCGHRLGLVIGGPSGSGKSTLAVSLTHEINVIVESLKTRRGWEEFSLRVRAFTLDRATPTLDAIQEGEGKDRHRLGVIKQPWTTELARQATIEFLQKKAESDIVISDLPGGDVDTITEITASGADIGILITKDWNFMRPWQKFFSMMGISRVSQIRSAQTVEGLSSIVATYDPGRMISGRAVDLDRMNRSWDRFISWLAEFLLFDILPAFVENRREKLIKLLGV